MPWTTLCTLDQLIEGKGIFIETAGHQLAVFLRDDQPYVMDNYCPHAGGNLAGGYIEDGCAVCPWHFWAFKLETGHLRESPAVQVPTYPTRLLKEDNQPPVVQADLP